MKNPFIITHPQFFANLYESQFVVWFPLASSAFSILWKSMLLANFWFPTFFKKIFFCVQQQKKNHTGLEQHESEKPILGVNCPFKCTSDHKKSWPKMAPKRDQLF